jgi:hypothetical protein
MLAVKALQDDGVMLESEVAGNELARQSCISAVKRMAVVSAVSQSARQCSAAL